MSLVAPQPAPRASEAAPVWPLVIADVREWPHAGPVLPLLVADMEARDTAQPLIYVLLDPRTSEVRYVGKTCDPQKRLRQHMAEARGKMMSHRAAWVRSLVREGLSPSLVPIEVTTMGAWQERERWWIAELRAMGCRLVNGTDGGEGLNNPSAETRAKIGAFQKGNKWCVGRAVSEETRAVMRERSTGRAHTPAACAKMSERQFGRKHSPETRAKIATANAGRVVSAEQRERMSNAKKGRPLSVETRQKLSLAGRGRRKSQEHREKIGAAHRGRHRSAEERERSAAVLRAHAQRAMELRGRIREAVVAALRRASCRLPAKWDSARVRPLSRLGLGGESVGPVLRDIEVAMGAGQMVIEVNERTTVGNLARAAERAMSRRP